MRTTVIIILNLLLVGCLNAQKYFTIGYKRTYIHPDNINRTVYTYNYSRQWLTQKMDFFNVLNGWDVNYSRRSSGTGIEIGFSRVKHKNDAFGVQPVNGRMGYRRIEVATSSMYMGMLLGIVARERLEISPVLDVDMMFFRCGTWYAEDDPTFKTGEYQGGLFRLKIAGTAGLNFALYPAVWLALNIRPYYQQPIGRVNVEALGDAIWGGSSAVKRERIANWGVVTSLSFIFDR